MISQVSASKRRIQLQASIRHYRPTNKKAKNSHAAAASTHAAATPNIQIILGTAESRELVQWHAPEALPLRSLLAYQTFLENRRRISSI